MSKPNSWWSSSIDKANTPMTLEMLKEGWDSLKDRGREPHGSAGNPHLVSGRTWKYGGHCWCSHEVSSHPEFEYEDEIDEDA